MSADPDPFEGDPEVRAGELALGLLEGADRAAALRQMLADPAFARRVDAWRERLGPLNDLIPEIAPPEGVWTKIDAKVAAKGGGSVRRWQAATAAAGALAAALLAVVVFRQPSQPPAPVRQPILVAQLGAPQATALLAVYEDAGGAIVVRPAVVDTGSKDPELWVIPKGRDPVSLGVIARDRPTRLNLGSRRALLVRDATLAVTLEPIGGSPSGKPTGPVVAKGTLSII